MLSARKMQLSCGKLSFFFMRVHIPVGSRSPKLFGLLNAKGGNGFPSPPFNFQFPLYSSVKRLSPNRPLSENTCTMKVPRISLNFF